MSWSPEEIRDWLLRCADRMEAAAPELNELDGRLGDGDLGATLEKCAIRMRTGLDGEFSMPSEVFKAGAMACARAIRLQLWHTAGGRLHGADQRNGGQVGT